MTTSPARKLSSALQGGFLLQVLQEDNEHQKIVSGSAKQFSTYSHIENNANTIKSADIFHGASQHRNQAFCTEYFYCSTATRSTRRFPWHVLSKQRSCAPFNGILINTDVGSPTAPDSTSCLNLRLVQDGYGEGSWYSASYKETKALFPSCALETSSPLASSSNTPGFQIPGAPDLRQCPAPTSKANGCPPLLRRRTYQG